MEVEAYIHTHIYTFTCIHTNSGNILNRSVILSYSSSNTNMYEPKAKTCDDIQIVLVFVLCL